MGEEERVGPLRFWKLSGKAQRLRGESGSQGRGWPFEGEVLSLHKAGGPF